MKVKVEVIDLDIRHVESLIEEIEGTLGQERCRPIRLLLQAYVTVLEIIQFKSISIAKLRKMIFGSKSEKTSGLFGKGKGKDETETETEAEGNSEASADSEDSQDSENSDSENSDSEDSQDDSKGKGNSGENSKNSKGSGKPRPPGHGRNGADAYVGCDKVTVPNELQPGDDCCPCCGSEKLYSQKRPRPLVRLSGQAPIAGTVYQLERVRCGECGKLYTAELPPEAGEKKYDETVASTIALMRYGQGFPWKRLERLQQSMGIPLPSSTQWKLVHNAHFPIVPAYEHLLDVAAQGQLFYNDDTTMRVLELTLKKQRNEPLIEDAPDRTGVFTTCVVSVFEQRHIVMYFTGPRHSGENLANLLQKRQADLPPPIQMCDALARNLPKEFQVILANCIVHARRNFVELAMVFPAEVEKVLESLKEVYTFDAKTKEEQMSPDERLRFHQAHSAPVMKELHKWLEERIEQKKVEPNSSLGQAIGFMLKHWEKLTLFLREPGAPLDNNICERALKRAILHRKNSLFYKNLNGAYVGDLYMTLIHTCWMCNANPHDYMTQLQRHSERVAEDPSLWMPWNYREQLVPAQAGSG